MQTQTNTQKCNRNNRAELCLTMRIRRKIDLLHELGFAKLKDTAEDVVFNALDDKIKALLEKKAQRAELTKKVRPIYKRVLSKAKI